MSEIAPLANELRLAIHRLTRRMRQQHSESDLTLAQLSALAVLWREGPMTAGELAAKEKVKPPSITRVVDALERQALVLREGSQTDGRQVLVRLTVVGRMRIEEYVKEREAWLAQQLLTLTAKERELLAKAAVIMNEIASR